MLTRKIIVGMILAVLVSMSTTAWGIIYYVDPNGDDSNGLSWPTAFNYLQNALDVVSSGDEIWVAKGTYYPDEGDTPTNDDREETFLLVDDVGIYGGFDATETARSQRDWVNNVTILSGDIGTSGVDTDNSYHVISSTDPTGTDTIVDGFTITKGYADGSSHPANTGGGIYIDEYYSPVTFKNCVISDNYSSNDGGGIYVTSHPDYSPTIIDSTITGNKSQLLWGGGAHVIHRLDLNGCTISDNEVGTSIYPGVGGGISYLGRGWGSKITNCIFKNNMSYDDGGALFLGVVMETQVFKMEISNCVFSGNDTRYGGAIEIMVPWNSPGDLTINNCVFSENTADRWGGAVYNICSSPDITNCTFVKNSATSRGGAMYNRYSNYGSSSPVVTNCIFWDDSAGTDGNEIYNETNCDPNFSYCDIEGCKPGGVWDPNFGTDGGGNIDADPCFVDIDANNFHLDWNSPCINTGDPNGDYTGQTDIDGEPRVMAGRVDMGSDEFSGIFNMDKEQWYDSIQEAINDANVGDTIEVGPGLYYESVDFNGVSCTVTSVDPNDDYIVAATIIDANSDSNNTGRVLTFDSSEDANSVITGFTITGGYVSGSNYGGGIYCYNASPTITKCVIAGNSGNPAGAGIFCGNASPTISNCLITGNSSSTAGAGIFCWDASPAISNCLIIGNTGTSYGGGMYNYFSADATLTNCTFSDNSAVYGGGMFNYLEASSTAPTVINCIFWADTAVYGPEIYSWTGSPKPSFGYCDIEGSGGSSGWDPNLGTDLGGNIDADPCFVDPNNDDFHLDWYSPCINAGDPNGDYNDLTDIDGQQRVIGSRVDIGADEFGRVHNITQNKWYIAIQAAIDDANDDDEIVAYPGTYNETVDFNGVACTVRSTDPYDWGVVEATIIDANDPNVYVVTFENSEEANSVLAGFTIRKGAVGVYCDWADPNIRNCIIEYNTFGAYGHWSGMTIENCLIRDNDLFGIYALGSPTIRYNKISGHYYDGIFLNSSSSSVKSNWIYDNGRYGVMIIPSSSAVLRNNTIVGNPTAGIYKHSGAQPTISNNIIWYNNLNDLVNCTATYSCIQDCNDAVGVGNICGDANEPNFVDLNNDDFHLNPNSPCIDVGDPNGGYIGEFDIDGEPRVINIPGKGDGIVDVDMGGDEYKP